MEGAVRSGKLGYWGRGFGVARCRDAPYHFGRHRVSGLGELGDWGRVFGVDRSPNRPYHRGI